MNRFLATRAAKPLLFVLAAVPFVWLLGRALADQLGPNPAEALVRASGDWTLRFLCVVLAVTPLRIGLGVPALAGFRRMLGLWVFFYASVHFLAYAWLDQSLEFSDIARDIAKRPFILVGFVSWLLLLALAATSWNAAVRWMGALQWRRLHRAVYGIAGLAILHFFWMRAAKNNLAEVALYALVLGLLLAWRVRRAWRQRRDGPANRRSA